MKHFAGKTAFVTGGARGIGLALAAAFAKIGMAVMLADIDGDAARKAAANLRSDGHDVRAVACDVADRDSVDAAVAACLAAFGKIHVLCNNAGVAGGSGIDAIAVDTWNWVLDVNVKGVLHGIHAALPHMRAHGEGGHIVNTASMAGLQSNLGFSPYAASKYAVVAMSEGLAIELRETGIGVSVICPGFVRTQIADSARNRQARYGPTARPVAGSAAALLAAKQAMLAQGGMASVDVAARTLDAIRAGELYVFTHPEMRGEVDERFEAITAALDRAARAGPAPR